jgi:DNA-directed RNA polymerase specialized sigma24 family protein
MMAHINKLKSIQREVFILIFIDDISIPDIAEMMGKTIGAIDQIYQRAKKNLEKIIPLPKNNSKKP